MPGVLLSLLLLIIVLELIRRRKLFAGYSLLWVSGCVAVLVLSLFPVLINKISRLLGIAYGPLAIFAIVFLFFLLILIDYSIKFSTLNKQVKELATVIALLQQEMEKNKENNSRL